MPENFPGGQAAADWLNIVGGIVGFVIGMAILVFMLYLYGRILHKAGYSGWLALLMLIPLVNIILLIWFAFAHWPVEHQAMAASSAPPTATYGTGESQPPQERGGYQPPGGHPTPQH